MEILETEPPYFTLPAVKVLFLIATQGAPPLKHPERYSHELIDFLSQCLRLLPIERPDAATLLVHPFLQKSCTTMEMGNLVNKSLKQR